MEKHVDFLREVTVVKSFNKNGHIFNVGDKIDQVKIPIGASRNWNLMYVNIGDEVFCVSLNYVT